MTETKLYNLALLSLRETSWLLFSYKNLEHLRGLVSGATNRTPSSDAVRCAPAFVMKFCSVQVRPEMK